MDPVVGARLAAEATFRVAGVATDPDVVAALLRSPAGVVTNTVYPTADLVREAQGVYRFEFNTDAAGVWAVRMTATGAVEAVAEKTITVLPSAVI